MTESPPSERRRLLERVPLFNCLSTSELDAVVDLFKEVAYRKGATVVREGDEGDSFFVILSGEVEVRIGADAERVVNRLKPGDFMGEIALLLGGKRSATVTVARSAKLLVLDRETFDRHFMRNPKVLEHFARVLSQRLATAHRREAIAKHVLAIGVRGQRGLKGKSLVAGALAGFLRDFSGRQVLLLRTVAPSRGRSLRPVHPRLSTLAGESLEALKSRLKPGGGDPVALTLELDPDGSEDSLVDRLSALLTRLSDLFPYVVLDLATEPGVLSASADEICDVTVEIVAKAEPVPSTNGLIRRYQVVNLYNPESEALPINHCEPFVIGADAELANRDPVGALTYLREESCTVASASLRRLARKILGTTVGVAVGGGAAFGIAHVGVFRVFEEAGIPVDVLAGTSMGSIVALGYAAGIRSPEMTEIARHIGNVRKMLSALDFTITKPGLLAGNRVVEIFGPLLGEIQTFEQLILPCQVVATDIRSGERVVIGSERLDAAFRASTSIPMLMTPVSRNGRVLVDGGLVDPVPAELVSEMGAEVCIAVNVVPPLQEGVETILSLAYRRANALNPLSYLGGARDLPNTFDVVMNSIQTLQHKLGNFKAISADVRINPDLAEYTWIEFYRAEEIIERGVEAAERAVPEIRRVLAGRIGGPVGSS
jgi:NTE family protein